MMTFIKATFLRPVALLALVAGGVLVLANIGATANPSSWKHQGWGMTDFSKTSIDYNEILSGGPPKDGIPSIDNPIFVKLGDMETAGVKLGDQEPVVSVAINGDARAYPIRILMWHEIVNDTVGGMPVTVTYCPLCNTALVFDRVIDGVTYDFGTTGKLRYSDLVMYDRQTESWWQQFSGEAIVGKLLGTVLKGIPARLESFERFAADHPDGQVQVPNRPGSRMYGANPYVGYDLSARPFLFRGDMPEDIEPMARIVMVDGGKGPTAVSLNHLRKVGKVELDGIKISWKKGQNSALEKRDIREGRDVGNVVAQTGSGNDVVYHVTFAFAYRAFVPDGFILQN